MPCSDQRIQLITKFIAKICKDVGFDKIDAACLSVFIEMTEKLLDKVMEMLSDTTEISQRTDSNFFDVSLLLHDLNISLDVPNGVSVCWSPKLANSSFLSKCPVDKPYPETVADFLKVTTSSTRQSLLIQCPSFAPPFPSDHTFQSTPLANNQHDLDRQKRLETNRVMESSINSFLSRQQNTITPLIEDSIRVDFDTVNYEIVR